MNLLPICRPFAYPNTPGMWHCRRGRLMEWNFLRQPGQGGMRGSSAPGILIFFPTPSPLASTQQLPLAPRRRRGGWSCRATWVGTVTTSSLDSRPDGREWNSASLPQTMRSRGRQMLEASRGTFRASLHRNIGQVQFDGVRSRETPLGSGAGRVCVTFADSSGPICPRHGKASLTLVSH